MTISRLAIKLFGQKNTVYRVIHEGQVVHVAETEGAAQAWIDAQ